MTLQIDGIDIVAAAEAAALVAGIIAALVIGLLIYLLVRPPRHVREARRRPAELEEGDAELMLRVMDRMEARLALLEQALDERESGPAIGSAGMDLEPAEGGREDRREK